MNKDKLPVVVSLTTWKKRIETVSKTIESIIKNCNPYKISLTLSIDEFPEKERELPDSLLEFNRNGILDFIWINRNLKSFKKVLFAIDKYKDFPVVSADDDCLYQEDYVKILYDKWLTDKSSIWTYKRVNITDAFYFGHGPACLYPPYCFRKYGIMMLSKEIIETRHDDIYYGVLAKMMGISVKKALIDNSHAPYVFHDEIEPLHQQEMRGEICINICLRSLGSSMCKLPAEELC